MKKLFFLSCVTAAASLATPAMATVEVSAPTSVGCATGPLAPPANSCAGYYSQNAFNNSDTDIDRQQDAIDLLLGEGNYTVDWNALVDAGLVVTSLTELNNLLTGAGGQVLIGLHWGNVPGAYGNVSGFYLWDDAAPGSIHLTDTQGWSNAVLYRVAAVPEPATWALMLFGFGAVGFAVRRSRKIRPALLQVA